MKKYTIDITDEAAKELNDMADGLGLSRVQILQRALGLMRLVIREIKNGKKLAIANAQNKVETELVIL
jgi:hypothetical protein